MIIGIDAREIQDDIITGIGRPLANFIRYFDTSASGQSLVLFSEKTVSCELPDTIKKVVIPPCPTLLWDQWRLPFALAAEHVDLFYSPYYKVPLTTPIPVVSQVLDLMHLVFPLYKLELGFAGRFALSLYGRACALKARSVITDSQHAKRDIMRLLKIEEHKIKVIPLGVAARYAPVKEKDILSLVRNGLRLPQKYVLYLGNFKPHKNVETLVLAFKRICKIVPDHRLVLAGPMDAHGKRIRQLVIQEDMADRVVFTGTIREKDRPEALMSMADAFVFPSLYEGFGLPPLEAMACGTPVICSQAASLPEVVGDAAVLFNPHDAEELGRAMEHLLTNDILKADLSRRGLARARRFGEEQTAGLLCRHLITLLGESV
jgi:glycosyltransferase involved in cell wall biosynthesis